MTISTSDITQDLAALQEHIRHLERLLKDLFRNAFVEKTVSSYEGITLIVKNGQELQQLYRQERALIRLKGFRSPASDGQY